VIIDLEDAVPAQAKTEARATVAAWLSTERPVYVRVNAAGTEWHGEDVRAVAREGLRGLVLPKAQDVHRLSQLASLIPDTAVLLPIVESAQGLWNALEIAGCPRVERLAFVRKRSGRGVDQALARSHLADGPPAGRSTA
jgi:citrate lyase subunit beta/citryl-CoA lyase